MIVAHFERIRIFLAVVRKQSFTDASIQFGISQSAVTQHIKKLEASLECSLFKRSREKTYLSASGEKFYILALKIEKAYNEASSLIESRYQKNEIVNSKRKWKLRHFT